MHGQDGKDLVKMTWDEFTEFQRWDEWPERADNPPMTTDFAYYYKNKIYYCAGEDFGYVICDENWNRLAYDENLLKLLTMPLHDGKSFKELLPELLVWP